MDMTLKDLTLASWSLLKGNLIGLLAATLPWIFANTALVILDSFISSDSIFIELAVQALSFIIAAGTSFAGFRYLLNQRGTYVQITQKKIINYCFATTYVGVAILLGMMLFVIPGLIIIALVSLFPLLILNENLGPIEAVSASVTLIRDCWIKITIFIIGLYFFSAIAGTFASYAFGRIGLNSTIFLCLNEILTSIIGIFSFPAIFIVYEKMNRNRSTQQEIGTTAP